MTLLRFIVLTLQDRDGGARGGNLLSDLAHWFDSSCVLNHLRLLKDAGVLRRAPSAERAQRLTDSGAALADRLRVEDDWRATLPPHHPPTADKLRAVADHCLKRARARFTA